MQIFLMILFGFLSGILGGMGMGGGTLLVPLFTFLDLSQRTVQAINLISFLPMAAVALILHAKNGLLEKNKVGWLIIPAVISAVLGAYLTKFVGDGVLKICFGVMLLALGVWQLILGIKAEIKEKNDKNDGNTKI